MVTSYTLGWMVALAFTMGAAAGGSVELLHWRRKTRALRTELLRQRKISEEMSKMMSLTNRSQW